ncbi:hypothetical protein, partial [Lacihabitans soyangensis]
EGKTAEEIQKTWEPDLSEYKKMRLKYVLYDCVKRFGWNKLYYI